MPVLAVLVLVGCPLPIPRTSVVRPGLRLTVVDPEGRPVGGARLVLTWSSNPHRRLHARTVRSVDQRGVAVVVERSKREWVMPLMMHGVPFHYWTWCVERKGFVTARGRIPWATRGRVQVVRVVLRRGSARRRCATVDPQGRRD